MPEPFEQVVEALRQQQDDAPPDLKPGIGYAAAWLEQKLVEERPEPTESERVALREWAKKHLKKPTPEDAEKALQTARERGWLTDDGFVWDQPEGEPSLTREEWWCLYYDAGGSVDGPWPPPTEAITQENRAAYLVKLDAYLDHPQDREAK